MKNIINEKPEGFVNPDDQRGGPNCGVTAIAIAMGITFKQSWELHKRVGKKSNKWKGSTYDRERMLVLHKLNAKFREHKTWDNITTYGRLTKSTKLPFKNYPISLQK